MRKLSLLILLFASSYALAGAVPVNITYQGTLKQNGIPASGPHNMEFDLTDSGGNPLGFTVQINNVNVNNGLFSVQLDFSNGGAHPVPWQSITPYIKVLIDGQALTPVEPLNSTAYALISSSTIDGAITLAKLDPSIQMLLMPAGAIMAFGGSNAPSGWFACDGSAVSRTTYSALFQAIGVAWGSGDGSTTFNLPDLRGRTAIGAGQGTGLSNRTLAQTVGEESHTLTVNEMPAHSHSATVNIPDPYIGSGRATIAGAMPGEFLPVSQGLPNLEITIGSTGGNASHNIMQPSAVVNYIIKS